MFGSKCHRCILFCSVTGLIYQPLIGRLNRNLLAYIYFLGIIPYSHALSYVVYQNMLRFGPTLTIEGREGDGRDYGPEIWALFSHKLMGQE